MPSIEPLVVARDGRDSGAEPVSSPTRIASGSRSIAQQKVRANRGVSPHAEIAVHGRAFASSTLLG
jgi:hypothetical protein